MEKIVFEKLIAAWQKAKTVDDCMSDLGFESTPLFEIAGHIADAIYYMLGEKTNIFDESVTATNLTRMDEAIDFSVSDCADVFLSEYRKKNQAVISKSVVDSINEAAAQMGIDYSAMVKVILCEWALQRDILSERVRTMENK